MKQNNDSTVIRTEGLTHRYGKLTALDDLHLEVVRGEIFGFLGPNGAGKTTTIRTLLDFIRPTAGHATILGMDSVKDSVEIRRRTGYLPSELTLWENWTGVQYIKWLEQIRRNGGILPEAQRLAQRLDYDLSRPLSGMSTGMKRKVGLIAALAHKPELLILDEPTIGLDPLMQKAFEDYMQDVRREGRTVFLCSHNLQEVEAICDRVGIIRNGRLEAVETVANLTSVTFRWMTIELDSPASMNGYSDIDGISDITLDGSTVRMRVSGDADIDRIIKLTAQHKVNDLRFVQPTLEEIFLTYYGEKE